MPSLVPPADSNLTGLLPASQPGAITLMPTRVIAPVGSEVMLTAGIAGNDGALRSRQTIEWILSQDSVGQLLQVSDDRHWFFSHFEQNPSHLISNSYAIGRTLSRVKLVDRGTPSPTDDVWLQRGLGWVTLSSATAGTSIVTVQAPSVDTWDQQRKTATVHWIDAQWSLPSPVVVQAGQTQLLETVLTHSTNGSPIANWIVRYETVTADVAGLAPDGGPAVEVTTDENGRAVAEVIPRTNQFGVVQIRIQIIRPAQNSADLPRLIVGEGMTTVTWTAPGLAVEVTGPDVAGLNSTATYRVEVSNPGDMPTRGIVLTDNITPGLEILDSQPASSSFGDRRQWHIGELAPRASQIITVNCRTVQRGTQRYCASATSENGPQADHCAETRIFVPAINLQMTGPQQAEVGEQVKYLIEIANQGDQPLTNVVLTDQYDAGLEHVQGEPSPIRKVLDHDIPAGQSARIAIDFRVISPGSLCHTLDVQADGGHTAQARKCLTATQPQPQPQPQIQANISGPNLKMVNENARYTMTVTNTGNTPLGNVQVLFTFSESLSPTLATDRHQWQQGGLLWSDLIPRLDVGASQSIDVVCQCRQADPAAWARIMVSAEENVSHTGEATTRIVEPLNNTPDPNHQTKAPSTSGELKVSIFPPSKPIVVGGPSRYLIEIMNDRDVGDKNVTLTVEVSQQMQIRGLNSNTAGVGGKNVSHGGRIQEMIPIAYLRPRESIDLQVSTTGVLAGEAVFLIKVNSLRSADEILRETRTTVMAH